MSSPQRRKELARLREIEDRKREEEERRKAALIMYDRIDEANCDETVKDILRRIAEHLGILWTEEGGSEK